MSSPRPTRPISGKAFVLGVVGALAAVALLVVVLFVLTSPTEPSGREVATSMCSAVAADPAGNRYAMATQHYPPDRDLGRVGTAASYREAARAIDGFCPQYFQQAELLRSMARLYDPSGG